jgi:hypothetical protein
VPQVMHLNHIKRSSYFLWLAFLHREPSISYLAQFGICS